MIKNIAIVSLSSGIVGEPYVQFEVEIGLRRLKEYGLDVKFMPHALKGLEYIKAHPNLWSGKERHITFRCKQNMMNDIADSFGTELDITQQPDDMILVNVYAGEDDMLLWAVQYADAVEVTAPQDLRERIAERLKNALKQYED